MIKDALFAPGKNAFDKGPNFDGSNRFFYNFRAVQELRNRKVFYYDRERSCVPYKDPTPKDNGHWEKVVKDVERYFYVKGAKPS